MTTVLGWPGSPMAMLAFREASREGRSRWVWGALSRSSTACIARRRDSSSCEREGDHEAEGRRGRAKGTLAWRRRSGKGGASRCCSSTSIKECSRGCGSSSLGRGYKRRNINRGTSNKTDERLTCHRGWLEDAVLLSVPPLGTVAPQPSDGEDHPHLAALPGPVGHVQNIIPTHSPLSTALITCGSKQGW